jgi:formylglycine-generating enzyme required for sulfatase activity
MKTILLVLFSMFIIGNIEIEKFVQISNTLYISKTEVSVSEFAEFYKSKYNTNFDFNEKIWLNTKQNQAYSEVYFSNENYKDYPIVGIDKNIADDYCNWLGKKLSNQYNKNIVCRLPTVKEWGEIVGKTNDKAINYKEYDLPNIVALPSERTNSKNISFLNGNVSEITYEGEIVGNNWERINPNELEIVSAFVGFRPVLEIKE